MQKWNGSLLRKFDDTVDGNASVGTAIVVRNTSDNSLAVIYSVDDTNSVQKNNPFVTDDFGRYSFYAPNGKYTIEFGDGSDSIEITLVDNFDLSSYDHNDFGGLDDDGGHEKIFQKTFDSLTALSSFSNTENGFYVRVKNSNGIEHVRVIAPSSNGTGVLLSSGNYANLVVTEPNTIYASQLGLVADANYTTYVNGDLATFVDANNISRIILDTGDIIVNDTLAFIYSKVTFGGEYKLLSDNIDNMLQRHKAERSGLKNYLGKYNTGMLSNQVIKAAIKRRELRVVLLGDSIAVSPDYDSFNTIPVGYINTTGVDNIDKQDCLGAQLFAELVNSVPTNVRVRLYSRSVGGLAYGNIDQAWDSIGALWTGREQVTAGKTWRDCVLDLNPDLVIHEMGMNESPSSYVDNYINKWDSYLITKQKKHCFDQVIMTTPNPNFWDAQTFGDFRDYDLNASKFYVAHLQRYMTRYTEVSLIDVALNSNIKRYGFDPRNCTFDAQATTLTFEDGSTNKVIGAGSSVLNTKFTPSNLPIYHSTTVLINPSVASNAANFDFKFNAGSVIVQFTAGEIRLFTALWPTSIGSVSASYPLVMSAGSDYTFTITIMPHGTYVYFNDTLILENTAAAYKSTLPMFFENSASSANVTVKSGNVRGATFPQYAVDTATNGEMYGNLNFTENQYGGGINHPSTVGLSEVYLPPLVEYLTDMSRSHTEYTSIVGGTSANEVVFIGRISNIQYNRVIVTEYGSGLEVIIEIGASSGYSVIKNTNGGTVTVYLDTYDMALFLINPSSPLFKFEYTGEWASKKHRKMGVVTPRGTLLPTVS